MRESIKNLSANELAQAFYEALAADDPNAFLEEPRSIDERGCIDGNFDLLAVAENVLRAIGPLSRKRPE